MGAISRKVLLAIYATLFLLCSVVIVWSHYSTYDSLRSSALEKLGSITSTLSGQINGDHVVRLLAKYDSPGMLIKNTQDAWYYVMHDHLQNAAETNALDRPILVISYDSLDQELQIVVTSDDEPRLRHRFEAGAGVLLKAYAEGGRWDPVNATAEAEMMAFDVLLDRKGAVSGIILATTPLEGIRAEAYHLLWRNMAVAGGLFLMAGILLFTSVGRWLAKQDDLHHALVVKHAGVNDSIDYVRKIQDALIPDHTKYADSFRDHFILHRPKDTVSGDFHWYHRTGPDQCLVAAVDCTGHGLPGAMLSAIGCSLLNEIAQTTPHADPAEMLALLNIRLMENLDQDGRKLGAGDGMDVALCHIDRKENVLLFAGALRPLYWVHSGELTVINGDRRPIGGAHHGSGRKFTCHRLAVQPGDRVYLFSDGYVDQLGGPQHKRFRNERFSELVMDSQHASMHDQGSILERAFLDWKGEGEQLDDVCVLGLEV